MRTPPANANGHRRRELRRRVLAEETRCALCDHPVDKTLGYLPDTHGPRCPTLTGGHCKGCVPHPDRGEVDEDIPRSRGGSPLDRKNCRLMHRRCNQWKSAMTLTEARTRLAGQHAAETKRTTITASSIW